MLVTTMFRLGHGWHRLAPKEHEEMPENETLDLWGPRSNKWRRLKQLVKKGEGENVGDVAEEALRCLRMVFKNLAKQK